jgi:hypothetical protein
LCIGRCAILSKLNYHMIFSVSPYTMKKFILKDECFAEFRDFWYIVGCSLFYTALLIRQLKNWKLLDQLL